MAKANYKKGDVIYFENKHRSHSWNNGLYAVVRYNVSSDELVLCKINNDGKLSTYDEGELSTCICSINSPYIFKTALKISRWTKSK